MNSITLTGADSSISLMLKPFPKASIRRNVTWEQASSGEWYPCDRGAQADFYDAEVTVFGEKADMDAFSAWLDAQGRETFEVSNVNGVVFAPNVNQTVDFDVTILGMQALKRVFWASPTNGVDEVTFTLRAIDPTLYGTTGSLSALSLEPQYEHGKSFESFPTFLQDGSAVHHDLRNDAGRFVGDFNQTTTEAIALLNFLVGVGRADSFAFPSIGVEYPFGVSKGDSVLCRAKEFSLNRSSLNRWNLGIEFVEALA